MVGIFKFSKISLCASRFIPGAVLRMSMFPDWPVFTLWSMRDVNSICLINTVFQLSFTLSFLPFLFKLLFENGYVQLTAVTTTFLRSNMDEKRKEDGNYKGTIFSRLHSAALASERVQCAVILVSPSLATLPSSLLSPLHIHSRWHGQEAQTALAARCNRLHHFAGRGYVD